MEPFSHVRNVCLPRKHRSRGRQGRKTKQCEHATHVSLYYTCMRDFAHGVIRRLHAQTRFIPRSHGRDAYYRRVRLLVVVVVRCGRLEPPPNLLGTLFRMAPTRRSRRKVISEMSQVKKPTLFRGFAMHKFA